MFQKRMDIPMGTNFALFLADFFQRLPKKSEM